MTRHPTSRSVIDALRQVGDKQHLLKALSTLQDLTDKAQDHPQWTCGPTGLQPFDTLWPEAALQGGRLVEWRAKDAGGAGVFALLSAAHVLQTRPARALVVIESPESRQRTARFSHRIHVSPFAAWGIDASRLLILRPSTVADALWTWEQALRSPGVAACMGWMEEDSSTVLRRLHRAAEVGDTVALALRSRRLESTNGFADVIWKIATVSPPDQQSPLYRRRFQVELVKCRGRNSGGVAMVEFTHEATRVPVVSAMARPASASSGRAVAWRSARAV